MKPKELRAIAVKAYEGLPSSDGISYVLIAVEQSTGSYQPVTSNMDVTYFIGLLHRCIISIERATYDAHMKADAMNAEDIKVN